MGGALVGVGGTLENGCSVSNMRHHSGGVEGSDLEQKNLVNASNELKEPTGDGRGSHGG